MDGIDDRARLLSISEVFGPTLQGEGPSLGRPAMFVRLGLCNLDCAWCDTPYTWDWTGKNGIKYDKSKELRRVSVGDLVDSLCRPGLPKRIVVTGGEPLVQSTSLVALVRTLTDADRTVEIETNGTLEPPTELLNLVQWNISPKLIGSGASEPRYNTVTLKQYTTATNYAFKFVITSEDDLNEVLTLAAWFDKSKMYVMPEGRTADEINSKLPTLFEWAAPLGINVTTRLHVLAFGDKRGI